MIAESDLNNIPGELRGIHQWVLWKTVERDGKRTKMPYNRNGAPAKSNDPATWGSFDEVCTKYERGGFNGIGFVFDKDDPFVGIDLDACRNPETGELTDWASEIVAAVNSYVEVSPSGTGIKLVARGKLPGGKGRVKKLKDVPKFGDKEPEIAFYDCGRYWCMTGQRLPGAQLCCEPRQEQLDVLLAKLFQGSRHGGDRKSKDHDDPLKNTAEILANTGWFERLSAACQNAQNGDRSERDFALCAAAAEHGFTADEIWARVADVGKFAEGGRRYFDQTWQRANESVAAKPIKRKKSRPIVIAESDHSAKKSVPGLRTENGRTDHANAMRFAELHGGTVRYCHSNGAWYRWDGKRLALDQQGQVDELAKQIGQSMWDWLGPNLPNLEPTEATEILRFVRYISSTRGIQNLLSLAKSEPTIAVKLDELDANPHYLNCSNGIVDLKAATLLPHHPKHLQTKIATAEFLQGAEGECPLWENALDTIFGGDQHLIRFVHRLFGMSLIGEVTEHVLPIFYGLGSNGKSLIVEMILEAVGDYGHKAPADLLLVKKGDCHPTERADLVGRRPVFCTETDSGRKLAEALSKELSGGDKITARWMRQNFFTFKPSHTLILVSNHKPRVSGTDHGLWRRLKLIPFTQRFWNEDAGENGPIELRADKQLKDKLRGELDGILSWMVRGCIDWQQHGLGEPVAVVAATNDYRAAEDILAVFIADCCELAQTCTVSAKELRKCYSEWCAANGEKPVSGRRLSDYIMEMGITKRHSGGTVYDGIQPR